MKAVGFPDVYSMLPYANFEFALQISRFDSNLLKLVYLSAKVRGWKSASLTSASRVRSRFLNLKSRRYLSVILIMSNMMCQVIGVTVRNWWSYSILNSLHLWGNHLHQTRQPSAPVRSSADTVTAILMPLSNHMSISAVNNKCADNLMKQTV